MLGVADRRTCPSRTGTLSERPAMRNPLWPAVKRTCRRRCPDRRSAELTWPTCALPEAHATTQRRHTCRQQHGTTRCCAELYSTLLAQAWSGRWCTSCGARGPARRRKVAPTPAGLCHCAADEDHYHPTPARVSAVYKLCAALDRALISGACVARAWGFRACSLPAPLRP